MPNDVERTPVISEPAAEIVAVMRPIHVTDFLPKVAYQIQGAEVSTEALELKEALEAFLEKNQEVIPNGAVTTDPDALEQFTKGFRNAIALVELWIDSMLSLIHI